MTKIDKIYSCYKIERWFFQHKMKPLAVLGRAFIRLVFSADIPYKAKIGKGTKFPHDALGIVMHPDTVIGENCKILHGTTFGGRSGHPQVPHVGNNVVIGAHAQIIGNITIGDNCIIGAGSVVVKDTPPCTVVVGNPAKVIKYVDQK